MTKKQQDPEVCAVPRWQMIKATLDNLDYMQFVEGANSDPEALMIDVRTENEHIADNIPGSILMDYLDKDLASKMEKLEKTKHYYIYCRTGRRSLRVCVLLRNMGFSQVCNLEGGIVSKPITRRKNS